MKKDLQKILIKDPLLILRPQNAYILIVFQFLCAEGTNINDGVSQFNHRNTFSNEYRDGSDTTDEWLRRLFFILLSFPKQLMEICHQKINL